MSKTWLTVMALCAALTAAAQAPQGGAPATNAAPNTAGDKPSGKKHECGSDAKDLCKGVQPGQGRIINCLAGKVDQIKNADCKAHISAVKDRENSVKQACATDIDANCKGLDFGTGLAKCLHKNHKTLSAGCKDAMHKGHGGGKGGMGGKGGGTGGATSNIESGESED